MRTLPRLAAVAVLLLLAGCGERSGVPVAQEPAPTPVTRPTMVPAADGPVTTALVTVLDKGSGPMACLGGIATSLPPQCEGPPVAGWDWAQHTGDVEDVSGVRWGEFVLVGGFDGTTLSPTEVTPADQVPTAPTSEGADPFATPCPEPAGGGVDDPARVGAGDLNRAFRVAAGLDDYVTSYVDRSRDGGTLEEADPSPSDRSDLHTLDVRVTGDPVAAEDAIREVWGGGLCVVDGGSRTAAELREIQDAPGDVPGFQGSGRAGAGVELYVTYDDGALHAWADQTYGAGTVSVTSLLRPVGNP